MDSHGYYNDPLGLYTTENLNADDLLFGIVFRQ